jgi:hydroxyacylglutathione hydrolase
MPEIREKWGFGALEVSRLILGPLETNCYIVTESKSRQAVVVDPAEDGERIAGRLLQEAAGLTSIILTHGHFDHMGGLAALRDRFPAEVYIQALDAKMISSSIENFSLFAGNPIEYTEPPSSLWDGMKIAIGNASLLVLHTPGHTPGSICLCGTGFVLTGDALFRNSIGRTDFPGSSTEVLLDSIRNRLLTLEDGTAVFPGHGDETTIGHERKRNPFLAGY